MIGLIDMDGTFPNLALIKVSTYFKSLGDKTKCPHCTAPCNSDD